jgi:hypothetical protein
MSPESSTVLPMRKEPTCGGSFGRVVEMGDMDAMGAMGPMRPMGVTLAGGLAWEGLFGCWGVWELSLLGLILSSGEGGVAGALVEMGLSDLGTGRWGTDAMTSWSSWRCGLDDGGGANGV